MQKTRIVVSSLLVGMLVSSAFADNRAPRTEKVQGVSFHAVSTSAAPGYSQGSIDGQTYYYASQALIRSEQVNSAQANAAALSLTGDFTGSSKASQVGVVVDGMLVAVGSMSLQNGQATVTGLSSSQLQRVAGLLSRKPTSPTNAAFVVKPMGQSNGEYVFEVYAQNVPSLRTYQVKLEATGGSAGSMAMTDVRIDEARQDYIFAGNDAIKAADHGGSRLGGTLFSGTVDITAPVYLGTWKFRPSADAAGTFNINVVPGSESFVADNGNVNLPINSVNATVQIGGKARLSD